MPIYEYRCKSCGEHFDRLSLSISQVAEVVCPACQSANVQRLISASAVRAVGEGSGDTDDTDIEETTPPKPPVFGRKELNEVLKNRK
jgi:putative FmdB family regulatory protein